jgi:predicted nucleic acid-binding Zn ribbon protein
MSHPPPREKRREFTAESAESAEKNTERRKKRFRHGEWAWGESDKFVIKTRLILQMPSHDRVARSSSMNASSANPVHDLRATNLRLRAIAICQAARKGFDLTHFGQGVIERSCSAALLGTIYFLVTLLLAWLSGAPPLMGLALGSVGLVSVMISGFTMILWGGPDNVLEQERAAVSQERDRLVEEVVLLRARQQAEAASQEPETVEAVHRTVTRCPYCDERIREDALKCKHCGEILSARLRRARNFHPGVAAVLSFLIPGLGQIYKGQVLTGLMWMFVLVPLGYLCCMVPGFILHVICLFDAASVPQG